MNNLRLLLFVFLMITSCQNDEDSEVSELAEITVIQYSLKSNVPVDNLAFSHNSIHVNDTIITAMIQDWDFSGDPYYNICSKSYDAWDSLLSLVDDNSSQASNHGMILINNTTDYENIGIVKSGNYYSLDFVEDDDMGDNKELLQALRAIYESMNACK